MSFDGTKPAANSALSSAEIRANFLALYDWARIKAWVNFNGVGTIAIREQYNVSSISDNGAGDYTINFSSALPDTNYAIFISNLGVQTNWVQLVSVIGSVYASSGPLTYTVNACRIQVGSSYSVGTLADSYIVNVVVVR